MPKKLTDTVKQEIVRLYKAHRSYKQISTELQVSERTVARLCRDVSREHYFPPGSVRGPAPKLGECSRVTVYIPDTLMEKCKAYTKLPASDTIRTALEQLISN